MATGGGEPSSCHGASFSIPLEVFVKNVRCQSFLLRKLIPYLKADISSMRQHFETSKMPFVNPVGVAIKKEKNGELIYMDFEVNDINELHEFREQSKNKPRNNISDELENLVQTKCYRNLASLSKDTIFCLHMSKEVYQQTQRQITQIPDGEGARDHNDRSKTTETRTYDTDQDIHKQIESLERMFVIHVPRHKVKSMFLEISKEEYKMEKSKSNGNLYLCTCRIPGRHDALEYKYRIIHDVGVGWFSDIRTGYTSMIKLNDGFIQRDIFQGDEVGLKAQIVHIIDRYRENSNTKELCFEIESVCRSRMLIKNRSYFLTDLVRMRFQSRQPKDLFVVVIIIGNIFNESEIDATSIQQNVARDAVHAIKKISLEQLTTSCCKYIPTVCHRLYIIAFGSTVSCVSEINFFSYFLGDKKFWCIDKCVKDGNIPMTNTDDTVESFLELYNELELCYKKSESNAYSTYLENMLKYASVKFTFQILNCSESISDVKLKEIIQDCFHKSVENEMYTAMRKYSIEQLYGCWCIVSQNEGARKCFKSRFEKHVIDILVKGTTVSTDQTRNILVEARSGLFEDLISQGDLIKSLVDSDKSDVYSLFTYLHSADKFTETYAKLNVEMYTTWLGQVKRHACSSKDEIVKSFIQILGLTERRPDVQKALGQYFIDKVESDTKELIAIWGRYETTLNQYHQAGELLVRLLMEALNKDRICTPQEILIALMGRSPVLSVKSRRTMQIVSTILEVFCSIKEGKSDLQTLADSMQNMWVWHTIFHGEGTYLLELLDEPICRTACAFFKRIGEMTRAENISYCFTEEIMAKEDYQITLFNQVMNALLERKLDLKAVLLKTKTRFCEQQTKLECVNEVLTTITKNMTDESLLLSFQNVLQQKEEELKKLNEVGLSVQKCEESWTGTGNLLDICSKLETPIKSQVFWNVYKANSQLEMNTNQDSMILSIRFLFSESLETIDIEVVNDTLMSILESGIRCYNTVWDELQNSTSVTFADIKVIFKDATQVEHLERERTLAEKTLNVRLCDTTIKTLQRLTNIHEVTFDMETLNLAVKAFHLDDEDFKCRLNVYAFLNGEARECLSFHEVKSELQFLFSLKEKLSKTTFDILREIGDAQTLLAFLKEVVDEDIRNLIDAVDDISEQYVQESTVSGLIEIKSFLQPLLLRTYENAEQFLDAVEKRTNSFGDNSEQVPVKLNDCMASLHQLKALYKNVANRGEQTKETIQRIISKGLFTISLNENTHTADVTCHCKEDKIVQVESTLVDLRSRALLLMNSERVREDKVCSSDDLNRFVLFVDQTLEIKALVQDLYYAGHMDYETFKSTSNGDYLLYVKEKLDADFKTWVAHLSYCREQHFLLNFLQGIQLHSLFQYIKNGERQEEVATLLKFIHPEFCISEWKRSYDQIEITETHDLLQRLGLSLDMRFDRNRFLHHEQVYSYSKTRMGIRESVQKGKLTLVNLEENSVDVVKTVLALFENTTNRLPEPYQLLFCCKDTKWDELQLLLNRCVYSKVFLSTDMLYCLANVELLPNEMQFRLVEALHFLSSSSQYLLCVVCRGGKNHLFVEEFSECVTTVLPSSDSNTETIFKSKYPDVMTMSSDIAGLGKTASIKRSARTKAQCVVTLHISGNVEKKTLIQQLNQLKLRPYHALHIDIANVNDVISLDTFLFELVFLRYVTAGIDSYHLTNKDIYIEVANTFGDHLRNSLQTAMCFHRKHLFWENFDNFDVSNELNSPTQIVCAYLDALDRNVLDTTDIILTGKESRQILPGERCKRLLAKHVTFTEDLSFVTVNSFLRVLADQLKKLSCSSFFKTTQITDMAGKAATIKSALVKALIDVSQEFAIRSIKGCKEIQSSTVSAGQSSRNENVDSMIRWEDSNHLIYVFHCQNIQTLSAMYRDKTKVPEDVRCLFESQMRKDLDDFKQMDQEQLQIILQKVSRTNPLALAPEKMKLLSSDYALTPDNLLKMVLIIMRIRARVPVVVMGETGCGKTSLIRYLANICEVPFDVMNIHAGTNLSEIVDKIRGNDAKASMCLSKERWLFLDEINTSENVNLMSDVICHHKFFGRQLSPNLVILSACNPYKLRSTEAICTAGLKAKVKTDELSRLVYRVLPLPQQLVDYVWDFGSLSKADERLYIRRMVDSLFDGNAHFCKILVDLLAMSQEFIRNVETAYNVSLRDVQRCRTLTRWFSEQMKKKESASSECYDSDLKAIIMALAHCYFSRLISHERRKDFLEEVSKLLLPHNGNLTSHEIHQIIITEQKDILNRMELPLGTAQNQSLQENVFMILVCILNKIPIFVVGKPGCSKSLAMQVIRSNLRGKDSKDDFFKTLPQIYCVSFQGSESSTSDGILKVFEKAENYQKSNREEDVVSVVILDEIGLAEVSRFNPLKVLHSLLEPGGACYPNVAVVGISNWALDASKMNRAIHLSRPDMDSEELFETGQSISHSFECVGSGQGNMIKADEKTFCTTNILPLLEKMADAYFEYSANLVFENFHGLRDYYALVKYVAQELTSSNSENVSCIIKRGLERNFGGLPSEKSKLYDVFKGSIDVTTKQTPVTDIISDNIKDTAARHLLLITSGQSVLGILEQNIQDIGRPRCEVIFGSQFEEDLTEDYNYRMLSRIILCMEEGIVLILKDLDTIYGSLYDMLNQNYTIIGKTKNCRVALGHYSNPICRVSDSFRCIVLVDETKVNYQDPPFLNRFEKQMLRFSDIICDDQETVINDLERWIDSLSDIEDGRFDETDLFPIYNRDLIASLVLKVCSGSQIERDERCVLVASCKDKLMWVMKSDAVLRLSKIRNQDMKEEAGLVQESYMKKPFHGGLLDFHNWDLEDSKGENIIRIIFTYTSVHTSVFRLIKCGRIQTEYVGAFKSEKQLSSRMDHFWKESDASLLCMQCSVKDDGKHVMLVMSVIERFRNEFMHKHPNKRKHVYLILHMSRDKETSLVVSHINFLSSWNLVTIDCLECPKVQLPELCGSSLIDTIKVMRPLDFQISQQLFWAFTRIRYCSSGRNIQGIQRLIDKIKSSKELLGFLDQCLWRLISDSQMSSSDWQLRVACDKQRISTSTGMVDALEMYLQNRIRNPLARVIFHLEAQSVLDSFFVEDCDSFSRRKLWREIIEDHNVFNVRNVPEESGPECYACETSDLSFRSPFFKHIYEHVEGTRGEFIKTICLIKERLSVEDDEILPGEIVKEVLLSLQHSIISPLPKLSPEYSNLASDYVDDFCNVLSASCIGVSGKNRIQIARRLVLRKANIDFDDFFQVVLSIHSAVWLHPHLFSTEMQILDICSEFIYIDWPNTCHTDGQVNGGSKKAVSNEIGILTVTLGDLDKLEQAANDKEEEAMTGETGRNMTESPARILAVTEGMNEYVSDDETCASCINHEQADDMTGAADRNMKTAEPSADNEGIHEENGLDFSNEYTFVDSICNKMLPTSETITLFPDIHGWCEVTSRVLPLVTSISNDPPSLDMLRFCHDITKSIINPCGIDITLLFELADNFTGCESFTQENVFHCIMNIVSSAKGATMECQHIVSDYFLKCLFNNPSEKCLDRLYTLILESKLPDESCSVLTLLVTSAIENEIDDIRDSNEDNTHVLQMIIQEDGNGTDVSVLTRPLFCSMDNFLKELSCRGRRSEPFLILLADIFEEKYKAHLKEVSHLNASSLFLASNKTIDEDGLCIRYVASVACFKAFIRLALSEDGVKEYDVAMNTTFAHGPEKKTIVFFNILRGRLSSQRMCSYVTKLQSSMPCLKQIELSSDFFLECYDNSPLSVHVPTMDCSRNLETDTLLIAKAKSSEGLLTVYHILLKDFFISRSFRSVDDTSKQRAERIIELAEDSLLDPSHMSFMTRLLGRRDFKISRFMHTPETPSRQCFINTTLTVLYSVLLSYRQGNHHSLLQTCLLEPCKINDLFLPGFPCGAQNKSNINARAASGSEAFTSCTCGYRVYHKSSKYDEGCMICNKPLNLKLVSSRFEEEEAPAIGWLHTEEMLSVRYSQRGLSPVACNILLFFIKGCLLGSYAIGLSAGDDMESIPNFCEIDVETSDLNTIDCHWENLLKLLNFEDFNLFIFLQSIILNEKSLLCDDDNSLQSIECRSNWEERFSKPMGSMTKNRFDVVSQAALEHAELNGLHHHKFETYIGEFNRLNDENEDLAVFRLAGNPSYENFFAELYPYVKQFPILDLILKRDNDIRLVKHLHAIVQWHLSVVSNTTYLFRKLDLLNKTVLDFINSRDDEKQREVLENRFDALCRSWDSICLAMHFKQINWSSRMSDCLVLDEHSQLFCALNLLTQIQNDIIETAMCMSFERKSSNLFVNSAGQVAVPKTPITQLKSEMLIQFEKDIVTIIRQESQCDPRYGHGQHIMYDFLEIENNLTAHVLVGKVYIQLEFNLLPRMVFSDELFRNVSLLTKDIRESIKQENLTGDMVKSVINSHEKNPKLVPELLKHIGTLLPLLKKTKGDPEESVAEYVETWKNILTTGFPLELLPGNMKLRQVVALYELLEELHADLVIKGIKKAYSMSMCLSDERYFRRFVKEHSTLAATLLKALKRFIHRCLDHRDADIRFPLQHYMSDSSFWPGETFSDGTIIVAQDRCEITDILPEGIMVGNICQIASVIKEEMESNRQGHLRVDAILHKASHDVPAPRQEDKRKRNLKSKRKY